MSERLTAEQVRECVEDLYWEGYNDGYVHRGHGIEETDWQAITDKLNAAWNSRAERTCRETTIDKFFNGCDSCGYMWQFFYSIGKRERPNYCPNCGCKVVGE